ncbi:MAG: hypothetical protein WCQ99_03765 [Pseudomonadota bacterium]
MYLTLLIIVTLLFPAVALLSFLLQRKKARAGKEVAILAASKAAKQLTLSKNFTITTTNKWCRVRSAFAYKHPDTRYDPLSHMYKISVSDGSGKELFAEQRTMTDFFKFFWTPKKKKKGAALPHCDAILLEFIPPLPGTYTLGFDLRAKEEHSEILNLKLLISEGVWPRKTKPSIHTCADLRKKK